MIQNYSFKNLQIGDNDLIGSQFNGHNLHLYLRERGIDSNHLVWNKESNDPNTYVIGRHSKKRKKIKKQIEKIHDDYCLNGVLNPLTYEILYDKQFLEADIVHYHLIHNLSFDMQLFPIMTRLKPTVWTVHDPWALSGHCIHHFSCQNWKSGCGDCPFLEIPYHMRKDNTALNFELKRIAVQNSQLNVIVASQYLMNMLKKSPIFENIKIHLVPFGINQNIFKPHTERKSLIREKLGMDQDAFVILFRADVTNIKGLDYVEHALQNIKTNKKVVLLVVGHEKNYRSVRFPTINLGWVKDEAKLAETFSIADLFLMPSKVESFGLMAVEVMSCGVLPIVLEGTALPDIVNAPECGVAVKRDKNAFAQTVQYFIDHDSERIERADKCLRFAKKEYNREIYVQRVIEVYEEAISNHKIDKSAQRILEQLKKYMTNRHIKPPTPRQPLIYRIKRQIKFIAHKLGVRI